MDISKDSKKKERNTKEDVLVKLKNLFKDKRTFLKRLLVSIPASLAFIVTFIIAGPFEMFFANMSYFNFTTGDFALYILGLAAILLVLTTIATTVLKGKIFDYIFSFVFGLAICGYVQGNLLNINLGALDGTPIAWNQYKVHSMINLVIWLMVLLIPYIVHYFSKKIWTKTVKFVSILLIGMQVISLVFSAADAKPIPHGNAYFASENMFNLSADKNVVVFILDYYDMEYIDSILQEDPDYLKPLSGFTYYKNMVGAYTRTYPAVNYLLTGKRTRFDIPYEQYQNESNNNSTFLKDIKANGYKTRLYIPASETIGSVGKLYETVDNIKFLDSESERNIDSPGISKGLLYLSAYKHMPHTLKPNFWMYTGDFEEYAQKSEQDTSTVAVKPNDIKFFDQLKHQKLKNSESQNCFTFYHMRGAHSPYVIDEFGKHDSGHDTDVISQAKGSLYIVYQYMQQMKDLGMYKDSTIIITADHGIFYKTLKKPANPIFFMKPAGKDNETLTYSNAPVSHEDFHATVIKAVGGDYKKYGTPIDEIAEDAVRDRYLWMTEGNGTVKIYKVSGDANDFSNWSIEEEFKAKYPFYKPK